MRAILNIAAYRFVALADPQTWRERIAERAQADALKGTVLLAPEGINLCLAGAEQGVRNFLAWLRAQQPFSELAAKESWSDALPFARLKVKVKAEIIRMNRPTIRPQTPSR